MGMFSLDNPFVFISGLLGNISSFVVFLAPVPTFVRVCKKKSTEGFQSIPYVISLFSAMLWIYYALVKTGAFLLITINAFGCVIETLYIAIYIAYAPREARIFTVKILVLLDILLFGSVVLLSHFLAKGANRVEFLGWTSVVFATSVFAAPLSVIRRVIRTKSAEFIPFYLSIMLTFSAVCWLLYGISLRDPHIGIPNIMGFAFGGAQIVLHVMYRKNSKKTVTEEVKLPEHSIDVANLSSVMDSEQAHQVQERSSEPEVHGHEMTGMSCRLQNERENNRRENIMDFPNLNPNLLLGKCEA